MLFRKVFQMDWFKGEEFKKDGRFLKGWVDVPLVFDIILLIIIILTNNKSHD